MLSMRSSVSPIVVSKLSISGEAVSGAVVQVDK